MCQDTERGHDNRIMIGLEGVQDKEHKRVESLDGLLALVWLF